MRCALCFQKIQCFSWRLKKRIPFSQCAIVLLFVNWCVLCSFHDPNFRFDFWVRSTQIPTMFLHACMHMQRALACTHTHTHTCMYTPTPQPPTTLLLPILFINVIAMPCLNIFIIGCGELQITADFISLSLSGYVYIYIYIYMCVTATRQGGVSKHEMLVRRQNWMQSRLLGHLVSIVSLVNDRFECLTAKQTRWSTLFNWIMIGLNVWMQNRHFSLHYLIGEWWVWMQNRHFGRQYLMIDLNVWMQNRHQSTLFNWMMVSLNVWVQNRHVIVDYLIGEW